MIFDIKPELDLTSGVDLYSEQEDVSVRIYQDKATIQAKNYMETPTFHQTLDLVRTYGSLDKQSYVQKKLPSSTYENLLMATQAVFQVGPLVTTKRPSSIDSYFALYDDVLFHIELTDKGIDYSASYLPQA